MVERKFQMDEPVDYERYPYIRPDLQAGYWGRMGLVVDLICAYDMPGRALVELGCNAGHLLEQVADPKWGYDIGDQPLAVARSKGLDVRKADITKDDLELAETVVITEVLEHLEDPHAMVRRLNVDPVRLVIASTPLGETEHDHYEQHCWGWDQWGFIELFNDAEFSVVAYVDNGVHQALAATR